MTVDCHLVYHERSLMYCTLPDETSRLCNHEVRLGMLVRGAYVCGCVRLCVGVCVCVCYDTYIHGEMAQSKTYTFPCEFFLV